MAKRKVLSLERAVEHYLTDLQIGGAPPRTIQSYSHILYLMVEVIGADQDPRFVDVDDMRTVLSRWTQAVSTNTVANRVSVCRSFWGWYCEEQADAGRPIDDPMRRIKRPKKTRPITRSLSASEVEKLMTAAGSKRDRLVVWMYAMTALRRSELIGLRWRDVNLEERVIRVMGKGGKGRLVPVHPVLADLLRDVYAELSEHRQAEPGMYVCCRRREFQDGRNTDRRREYLYPEEPMGYSTPEKIIKRLARVAGLDDPDHVSPHCLRRGFSTRFLLENPGDLFNLQAILGHADISTTRGYLRDAEAEGLREALDRVTFREGE